MLQQQRKLTHPAVLTKSSNNELHSGSTAVDHNQVSPTEGRGSFISIIGID